MIPALQKEAGGVIREVWCCWGSGLVRGCSQQLTECRWVFGLLGSLWHTGVIGKTLRADPCYEVQSPGPRESLASAQTQYTLHSEECEDHLQPRFSWPPELLEFFLRHPRSPTLIWGSLVLRQSSWEETGTLGPWASVMSRDELAGNQGEWCFLFSESLLKQKCFHKAYGHHKTAVCCRIL